MTEGVVVDERARRSLRAVIGELLETSTRADLALRRVRLAALDLTDAEIQGPELCRVLLGQLDASTLVDAAADRTRSREGLHRLAQWLTSDRLHVRSAGLGAWTPDFSVYEGGVRSRTSLIGAHYFGSPQLTVGPSVTVIDPNPETGRLLKGRFHELWVRAHDVRPAILRVLDRELNAGAGQHERS